ncbi:hypothetical protein GDO81_009891 [Engystomops pustulosus]|uniref:Leptin receptor n=1 Tax=Engystomops pustulosus TaxID=76066 RepID=A0AAV7BWD6_ENGPU|nr:hypothetical protein GDO81_009891 [Engystomops pustulosus]
MADRAEMFSLSTFHSLSPPGCRPSQDISLEEFDDEDLSEITDDCGIGLNYDSDHCDKEGLGFGRCDPSRALCTFQEDFQEFEMIDEEEDEDEEEEEDELPPQENRKHVEAPPSPSPSPLPPEDSLKNRPCTLRLSAPRTQDTLNNNGGFISQSDTWADPERNETELESHTQVTHTDLDTLKEDDSDSVEAELVNEEVTDPSRIVADRNHVSSHGGPWESDSELRVSTPTHVNLEDLSLEQRGSTRGHPSNSSNETTSPSSDPGIEADLTSRGRFLPTGHCSQDLSSPGSDSDIEGEIEAAFACDGGRLVGNMISSISETELDLTSESSSGRSSHLTNSIEEASSPTSDPEPDHVGEGGRQGIKDSILLDREGESEPLMMEPEEKYGTWNEEETMAQEKVDQTKERSLESIRRSFYLPVGPKLMPETDANSEYDSDSESEADLSEDSDSPWLLSNLVNKMISEGSYPISCPDECFQRQSPSCDTLSPASELDPEPASPDIETDLTSSKEPSQELDTAQQSIELVDMETLQHSLSHHEREQNGPGLYVLHDSCDTVTPIFEGIPLQLEGLSHTAKCRPQSPGHVAEQKPWPGTEQILQERRHGWDIDRDLDSGILEDNDLCDDLCQELDQNQPTMDTSTAKTNHGFNLEYTADEDKDIPYYRSLKSSPYHNCVEEESFMERPTAESRIIDDSLAYDSMKYTLVVDEHTQLELVSLQRCTSILSDGSDLLRACDACDLEEDDFGDDLEAHENESSSEDSSPEPNLPFSKKFLNVFVNSTSRSSSKLMVLTEIYSFVKAFIFF